METHLNRPAGLCVRLAISSSRILTCFTPGILPHHTIWMKLFENLSYVVLDEVHQYRGVFGSHVANLIRRLRRLCHHYGSRPTFICSSASIGNAKELAERLIGDEVTMINQSGAPIGRKTGYLPEPTPFRRSRSCSSHDEPGTKAGRADCQGTDSVSSKHLEPTSIRRSRPRHIYKRLHVLRDNQGGDGPHREWDSDNRLRAHQADGGVALVKPSHGRPAAGHTSQRDPRIQRAGYLPSERRQIESELRSQKALCVVSTNALELGIDIGSMSAAVLCGYPGSIASTWQRMGRAGRRSQQSLAILVAGWGSARSVHRESA